MSVGTPEGTGATSGAEGPISGRRWSPLRGRRWSPLPVIAHLVAIALGICAGLTVMAALDLPDVGAEANAAREQSAAAAVEQAADAAANECREAVREAAGEASELPDEILAVMERECDGGSALDPEALCYTAVREVTSVGPGRSEAVTACEQAFGG